MKLSNDVWNCLLAFQRQQPLMLSTGNLDWFKERLMCSDSVVDIDDSMLVVHQLDQTVYYLGRLILLFKVMHKLNVVFEDDFVRVSNNCCMYQAARI